MRDNRGLDFSQGYRDAKETAFEDVKDGDVLSVYVGYPSFVVRARRNGNNLSFIDLRSGLSEEFLTQLVLDSGDVTYKIGFPTRIIGRHDYLEFPDEIKPYYLSLSTETHHNGGYVLVRFPHVLDEEDVKTIERALKERKVEIRNYLRSDIHG